MKVWGRICKIYLQIFKIIKFPYLLLLLKANSKSYSNDSSSLFTLLPAQNLPRVILTDHKLYLHSPTYPNMLFYYFSCSSLVCSSFLTSLQTNIFVKIIRLSTIFPSLHANKYTVGRSTSCGSLRFEYKFLVIAGDSNGLTYVLTIWLLRVACHLYDEMTSSFGLNS